MLLTWSNPILNLISIIFNVLQQNQVSFSIHDYQNHELTHKIL